MTHGAPTASEATEWNSVQPRIGAPDQQQRLEQGRDDLARAVAVASAVVEVAALSEQELTHPGIGAMVVSFASCLRLTPLHECTFVLYTCNDNSHTSEICFGC